MEAVKFLEEYKRMCDSNDSCDSCDADGQCIGYGTNNAAGVVAIVEEWSKAHSRKSRQSKFLERWPNAKVFVDGVLDFCPQELDSHYPCQSTDVEMRCQSCRRKFWMQEVE